MLKQLISFQLIFILLTNWLIVAPLNKNYLKNTEKIDFFYIDVDSILWFMEQFQEIFSKISL